MLKVLDPDSKCLLTDAEDALQDFKSPKRTKYKDSQVLRSKCLNIRVCSQNQIRGGGG